MKADEAPVDHDPFPAPHRPAALPPSHPHSAEARAYADQAAKREVFVRFNNEQAHKLADEAKRLPASESLKRYNLQRTAQRHALEAHKIASGRSFVSTEGGMTAARKLGITHEGMIGHRIDGVPPGARRGSDGAYYVVDPNPAAERLANIAR